MIRTVNLDIRKGEYLSDALHRHGKENIPTRVILNKVLPGLGATYCEIMSERSSIIIEPNVPVIVGKTEKHKNLLGVYRGVKTDEVARHLRKHPVGCKIMVTPESFRKVKQAMEDEGVDMYNDFFMLFDECEKIIQDNDFRETIEAPLDDFFLSGRWLLSVPHRFFLVIRGSRNMVLPNCVSCRTTITVIRFA